MSQLMISHSTDLVQLQDEGYAIALVEGSLIVDEIPYAEGNEVNYGSIVCSLESDGEKAVGPGDHTVFWTGSRPNESQIGMRKEGRDTVVGEFDPPQEMGGRKVRFHLSIKPASGAYSNYYEKISAYANILSRGTKKIDREATPRTLEVKQEWEEKNPFIYRDGTAEVRGGNAINGRLREERIAIIGLGGTGSYILDYVAKSPVSEIHLFDRDRMRAHNGYRIPGCISVEDLKRGPRKVDWLKQEYSQLRRGIHAHPVNVRSPVPNQVREATFVFMSMDEPGERTPIIDTLVDLGIPFIYVGINVRLTRNTQGQSEAEAGMLCSLFAPEDEWKKEDVKRRLNITQTAEEQRAAYGKNVQMAELNAMNAAMAVIQWKKYRGCYTDHWRTAESVYEVGMQVLTKRGRHRGQ